MYPMYPPNKKPRIESLYLVITKPKAAPIIKDKPKITQTTTSLTPLGKNNWKNRMNKIVVVPTQVIMKIVTISKYDPNKTSNIPPKNSYLLTR